MIYRQDIIEYAIKNSTTPSTLCEELDQETKDTEESAQMVIGKLEASFLGFLLRSINAKRVLEFGTFTGYSALAMAESLPEDGELTTLDINPKTVEKGKKYWEKSPHGKKITSLIGSALESIQKIKGPIDMAFIDADKENYSFYLEESLKLLSPNGIIVVDNVLWSGKVLESDPKESSTKAIKEFNESVKNRKDLYATFLPIRDGIFLIRKK